jgi:CheY-like chemotaxis protein
MGAAGQPDEEHSMKAKRVLVVDDDPVVGTSFERVLTPQGYAVMTARSGAEALDRLAREDYDMVYTDIKMPGMDGIEVARRIKASRPWLPVLIITGYGDAQNEAQAEAIGVSAFLHKPLSPESIEVSAMEACAEAVVQPAPAVPALEKRAPKDGFALAARNVGLFFAAPLVALFYVLIGPFVLLGMLAWIAFKALLPGHKAE